MKQKAFFLVILFLWGCFNKAPEKTGLKGNPMPSFNLLLSDSITYINTSNIPLGKPVVLFYYGPDCPYSRAQMEEIIDNMQLLKNIQFYLITNWPFVQMEKFCKHYQLKKYQNIVTTVDYTDFFKKYYNAKWVPYMAIYSKSKILNEAFVGIINGRQIKKVAEEY